MTGPSLLALGLALTLLRPRGVPARHRDLVSRGSGPRVGLAELGGLSFGVLGLMLDGRVGLVVAPMLAVACAMGLRRVLASRRAPPADSRNVAFVLDLVSGVLASGAPPEVALSTVAAAVAGCGPAAMVRAVTPLRTVGRLLELGAVPEVAWADLDTSHGFEGVAAAGRRCASSGARLVGAFGAVAVELRQQRHAAAMARAQRVGVWTLLPLGLCFLPAFICLGVVPVVAGVAGQVLSGVPS
jgi:pilus assembly protein TadC